MRVYDIHLFNRFIAPPQFHFYPRVGRFEHPLVSFPKRLNITSKLMMNGMIKMPNLLQHLLMNLRRTAEESTILCIMGLGDRMEAFWRVEGIVGYCQEKKKMVRTGGLEPTTASTEIKAQAGHNKPKSRHKESQPGHKQKVTNSQRVTSQTNKDVPPTNPGLPENTTKALQEHNISITETELPSDLDALIKLWPDLPDKIRQSRGGGRSVDFRNRPGGLQGLPL